MENINQSMKINKFIKKLKQIKLSCKKDANGIKKSDEQRKIPGSEIKPVKHSRWEEITPQKYPPYSTRFESSRDTNSNRDNDTLTFGNLRPSSIKEENTQNEENRITEEIKLNKELISDVCVNIFNNHSLFNNEEKDYFLSYKKLFEILYKINILSPGRTTRTNFYLIESEIEILLKKINTLGLRKLNSKQFMNFIAVLADRIFNTEFEKNPKRAIEKLIVEYFLTYSNYINNTIDKDEDDIENNQKGNLYLFIYKKFNFIGTNKIIEHFPSSGQFYHKHIQKRIKSFTIDDNTIFLINSVYPGLKHIYSTYFYYEMNSFQEPYQVIYGSFNNLTEFCKNFEICPYIITLEKLAVLFDVIVNLHPSDVTNNSENPQLIETKKELGKIFTLSKFCLLLIHLGIFAFDKISKSFDLFSCVTKEGEINKKLSEGAQISHNSSTPKSELKFGELGNAEKLILFFERLESSEGVIKMKNKINKPWNSKFSLRPTKHTIEKINTNFLKIFVNHNNQMKNNSAEYNLLNNNSHSKFQTYSSILKEKYENEIETFKEIFDYYTQFGNKLICEYMTISAFLKFLKDANIIVPITRKIVFKEFSSKSRSISPITNRNLSYKNLINVKNTSPNKSSNYNNTGNSGKLSESDASIIFYDLTGVKNEKLKLQVIKGNSPKNDISSTKTISTLTSYSSNQNILANNMDFEKFLKSFELIASKLYPDKSLEDALIKFLDDDLNDYLKSNKFCQESKKNLADAVEFLKREEIVYTNIKL